MELWQLGVGDIATLVTSGQVSPVEVVRALLRRIESLEPDVQAWAALDPEGALAAAERIAAGRARGVKQPGMLTGVPVGIKDIFWTKGLRTAAGSRVLADFVPREDATTVKRLRRADAVILGKLHTAEFAGADPPPTRNAWNPEHTPGGSSSGSAVAVAMGMVPAALGTQTGGSVLRPAAYNGVVGLKPSYGLVSCYGVIPAAWSFDTVGIFARSVQDAALVLEVLAGYDKKDPATAHRPRVRYSRDALDSAPPRLGVVRDYFWERCDASVKREIEQATARLSRAGATLEEVRLPACFSRIHAEHRLINDSEIAAYHEARFAESSHLYGPNIAARVRRGLSHPAAAYARALHERPAVIAEMLKMTTGVDALLTPATPTPAPLGRASTGDPAFQTPWSYCGFPSVSLPSGTTESGLPLGVQLVAARWSDRRLLHVARWCEATLDCRTRPPCWSAAYG